MIATISAVLTATVVIGAGRTFLPRTEAAVAEPARLTPVALR